MVYFDETSWKKRQLQGAPFLTASPIIALQILPQLYKEQKKY